MDKYYVDGKSKPSIDPLDFDEPVGIYLADIVDEAIAAKDRDLADANHALLLANSSADALRRVAEQRQGEIERLRRAVEWCIDNAAERMSDGSMMFADYGVQIPAEFADIIKPTTGASNG